MRDTHSIHKNWFFCQGLQKTNQMPEQCQRIEIPHNAVDVPFNYFNEQDLHQDFTYYYPLACHENDLVKQQIMRFEGVMCNAHVYVNGVLVQQYSDGFTPFDVHLTPHLHVGENLIVVTLSGVENPNIPPFGGMIDFLCFPGIYRDVSVTSFDAVRIENIKVETCNVLTQPSVNLKVMLQELAPYTGPLNLTFTLVDPDGESIATEQWSVATVTSEALELNVFSLDKVQLWDLDSPKRYQVEVTLSGMNINDCYRTLFGFREAEFTVEGFYLNGSRRQLIGINRHQSYPHVGYAMGKRAQQLDADIIKYELGFNLARTSHYPQSPYFLDRCDEIGLLVFEEIAGWQHIGDKAWQQKSIENVAAMVKRDWNHPSVILWGVRINESPDDHDFYTQTNAMAKRLDSTRQTGGVRCIQNSEYLEDVYTMNDFILTDSQLNPAAAVNLRSPQNVTGLDNPVPYLVTEYAGHMYPTKRHDCEVWQNEHVMRHLKVLDASFANPNISGAIAWCLFDYNTHRDFGSGDKVCYHGVTDAFRVPKFAAYVYSSQQSPDNGVVIKPVTYWTRGERPEAKALPLVILTNCDYVDVQVGSGESRRFYPDRGRFAHLPHPPIVIDQMNQGDLPLGDWGYTWSDLKLSGYVNGEKVMETELSASPVPTQLEVTVQTTELNAHCGDTTRVVLKALDQKGHLMPYFQDVVRVEVSDNLRLIGPGALSMEGGVASFWVRAYQGGQGSIQIQSQVFALENIELMVKECLVEKKDNKEVQHG